MLRPKSDIKNDYLLCKDVLFAATVKNRFSLNLSADL